MPTFLLYMSQSSLCSRGSSLTLRSRVVPSCCREIL